MGFSLSAVTLREFLTDRAFRQRKVSARYGDC
jgi:hypothetical protein